MSDFELTPDEINLIIENIDVVVLSTEVNQQEIQSLSDVTDELLERIAVEYGGLTDPVGQFQSWIYGVISDFSSYITSSISGLISQFSDTILGAINEIITTFQNFVVTQIDGLVEQVTTLLSQTLPSAINSALDTLTTGVTQALSTIQGIIDEITSSLQALPQTVESALQSVQNVLAQITQVISAIPSTIQSVLSQIQAMLEPIQQSIQGIASTVQNTATQIYESLKGVAESVSEIVNNIVTSLGQIPTQIENILTQITQSLQAIPEQISSIFSGLISSITQATEQISGLIGQITSSLSEIPAKINEIIDQVLTGLEQIPETISQIFANLPDLIIEKVGEVQTWVWEHLPEELKTFLETAPQALEQVGVSITGFINAILKFPDWFPRWFQENIAEPISEAINALGSAIWDALPDEIKGFFTWVQETLWASIEGVVKGIQDAINWLTTTFTQGWESFINWITKDLPGFFSWLQDTFWGAIKGIADTITGFFQWVSEEFQAGWQSFVDWITKEVPSFFSEVQNVLGSLAEALSGGIEWLKSEFGKALEGLNKWFSEDLPANWDWLQKTVWDSTLAPIANTVWDWLQNAQNFGTWVGESFDGVVTGASTFISETVPQYVGESLKQIQDFFGTVGKDFPVIAQFVFEQVSGAITGLQKFLVEQVMNFGYAMSDWLKGICEAVFVQPIRSMYESIWKDVQESLFKVYIPKQGELEYMLVHQLFFLSPFVVMRVIGAVIMQLGEIFHGVEWHIRPLGVGGTFTFKPTYIFKELGSLVFHIPETLFSAVVTYMSYWFAQSYIKPLNAIFRDVIPITLPEPMMLREMTRRMMATEGFDAFRTLMWRNLAMWGYATPFIQMYTNKIWKERGTVKGEKIVAGWQMEVPGAVPTPVEVDPFVIFKDRFGKDRIFPLTLIYSIPDERTLAKFMVHDLFLTFDDYMAVVKARGVIEDMAYMYYLDRFKYPSPEKLYEFFSRAEAGLLWYSPPESVAQLAKRDAETVGAFMPKPPAQLNVTSTEIAKTILGAISTYMKWHDYALFSWIDGFTSDAFINLDLMADIPTRIDARWMYKWSIFSTVLGEEFSPDEYGLGKIVIARAIHPKFVTAVTVAEAMNALAEERTLFRTGIINLFRVGTLTIKKLMELFAGLFKIKFKVPAWNSDTLMYEKTEVEVPVRFTEGEAKLMTLRSLYDRAYRGFRDIQRVIYMMITQGWDSPNKYAEYLKQVAGLIGKVVKEIAREMGLETGFEMIFDEKWVPILNLHAELRYNYNTLMRLRRWLWYSLYQLWGRFMRGYIGDDELEKFVDSLVKTLKLTDQEREFFTDVAKMFRDIYRRELRAKAILRKLRKGLIRVEEAKAELARLGLDEETIDALIETEVKVYVPTVSTLATLAEVVPDAIVLLEKVLEAQGIPPEERDIWRRYVLIKPLKDEAGRLVTELIMDYAKGVISKADFERFMQEMMMFGYSKEEIELLTKLAELRRRRYALAS